MPQALSNRYARALADAVLAPGAGHDPNQVLSELRSFTALTTESPELRNILLSPAVSLTKKRAVVSRFAETLPLSRLVRNFLYVLVDRRRTALLIELVRA